MRLGTGPHSKPLARFLFTALRADEAAVPQRRTLAGAADAGADETVGGGSAVMLDALRSTAVTTRSRGEGALS